MRSLSGWWRGRGRGRGRGFAMRGRGGAFNQSRTAPEGEGHEEGKEAELPPIERAWTHDGFEELKRKEETRRAENLAARNAQGSPKRGGFVSGRGGFAARGRGGYMRGGFSPSAASGHFGRVRYAMKPELMWTKQHEAFLFFETALKPRPGQGPSFRVRIPGHQTQVIRTNPGPRATPKASTSKAQSEGSEAGDNILLSDPSSACWERTGDCCRVTRRGNAHRRGFHCPTRIGCREVRFSTRAGKGPASAFVARAYRARSRKCSLRPGCNSD